MDYRPRLLRLDETGNSNFLVLEEAELENAVPEKAVLKKVALEKSVLE